MLASRLPRLEVLYHALFLFSLIHLLATCTTFVAAANCQDIVSSAIKSAPLEGVSIFCCQANSTTCDPAGCNTPEYPQLVICQSALSGKAVSCMLRPQTSPPCAVYLGFEPPSGVVLDTAAGADRRLPVEQKILEHWDMLRFKPDGALMCCQNSPCSISAGDGLREFEEDWCARLNNTYTLSCIGDPSRGVCEVIRGGDDGVDRFYTVNLAVAPDPSATSTTTTTTTSSTSSSSSLASTTTSSSLSSSSTPQPPPTQPVEPTHDVTISANGRPALPISGIIALAVVGLVAGVGATYIVLRVRRRVTEHAIAPLPVLPRSPTPAARWTSRMSEHFGPGKKPFRVLRADEVSTHAVSNSAASPPPYSLTTDV